MRFTLLFVALFACSTDKIAGEGTEGLGSGAPTTAPTGSADSDGDGVVDAEDRCPGFDDNLDDDQDGVADGCDPCPADPLDDSDGDGTCDSEDRCDGFSDQADSDGDLIPDGCDLCQGFDDAVDGDGDGSADGCDACPLDVMDDSDGDGLCDSEDTCPATAGGTCDQDVDGCPDDADLDGVVDCLDACGGFDDAVDGDGDGVADGCDVCPLDSGDDSDGDGSCDSVDRCPGYSDLADADGDLVPDGCDICLSYDDAVDGDGDGVPDGCDNCPGTANPVQEDTDGNGLGDACDGCVGPDSDGDGVANVCDVCNGFDDAQDADGDGAPDGCDPCPLDLNGDSDGDGTCDSDDLCPGFDDAVDTDGNGVPDGCDTGPGPGPGVRPMTMGYFTSWSVYGRNFHVDDIDASKLTHILYAFVNISGGTCVLGDPWADTQLPYPGDTGPLYGNFNQLHELRAANPHLKIVLSVGGWTWSGNFSDAAATQADREVFALGCVSLMQTYDFDGLDIDWEYPVEGGLSSNTTRTDDGVNYTMMLQELRDELDLAEASDGRDYSLSIAAPAFETSAQHLELASLAGILDWVGLMTYDYRGSWSAVTGFNSPLYAPGGDPGNPDDYSDWGVNYYLSGGFTPGQLVLGVPFYGRGFANVGPTNDGLYQSFSGVPTGTWEPGMYDYSDLADNWIPFASTFRDANSGAPWLYDAGQQVFISYEDPTALAQKADYVVANSLGGMMIWELSADTDTAELLTAIDDGYTAALP